jgi:hypothetical protein
MAFGTLKADTLTHSTAGSLDTNYVVNGSAKAWANKATDGASLPDSFNISSIDDDGTGDFGLNFSTSMSNANYSVAHATNDMASGGSYHWADLTSGTQSTSSFDGETGYISSTANRTNYDGQAFMVVHGDLA